MKDLLRFWRFRYIVWLAIPLLLGWVLHDISPQNVGAILNRLSLPQIAGLVGVNSGVLLLFSARWWLISRVQGYPIPYLTLAGYRLASFSVSYFTPGPQFGGEPLQVYLVQRNHKVPLSTAISGVTLDKLLELLSNFAFLVVGIVIILQGQVFPGLVGQKAIWFALLLLTFVIGFLAVIWTGRHPVSGLWQVAGRFFTGKRVRLTGGISSIYQTIKNSEDQIAYFCRQYPLVVGQAMVISGLIWVSIIGEFWLATYILGLQLTPIQVVSLLTAARIAFLLPLPGGLGALEAGQVMAFSVMGLDPAIGISLSLLIRARDIVVGGIGLWWGGMTLPSVQGPRKVY